MRIFTDTARFLRDTPYKAAELAQRMAKDARGDLKVSVVIPFYNRIDWTIEAIQSVERRPIRTLRFCLSMMDQLKTFCFSMRR